MVAKDAGRKSARSLSPGMAKGYETSASEATRSDHQIFPGHARKVWGKIK